MEGLHFPQYEFSTRNREGQLQIFDPVRKRYVALTPEEWVRQHVIRYLLDDKGFPSGLISVEGSIRLFKTKKRYDIATFDNRGTPLLVVECKSPEVKLNPAVIDQVVRYNLTLGAAYLFVTNGLVHIVLENTGDGYNQVQELPAYGDISRQ